MVSGDQLKLITLRALAIYSRPSRVVFRCNLDRTVVPPDDSEAERVIEEFGRRHDLAPTPHHSVILAGLEGFLQSNKPNVLKGAAWLRPELRVRVRHLKAKGVLRHASVKQLLTD